MIHLRSSTLYNPMWPIHFTKLILLSPLTFNKSSLSEPGICTCYGKLHMHSRFLTVSYWVVLAREGKKSIVYNIHIVVISGTKMPHLWVVLSQDSPFYGSWSTMPGSSLVRYQDGSYFGSTLPRCSIFSSLRAPSSWIPACWQLMRPKQKCYDTVSCLAYAN